MFSRFGGHRVVRVAVVVTLVLALGVAVRIAMTSGPAPYKGPPATAVVGDKVVYTAARHQANHVTVTETSDGDGMVLTYLIDDVVPINASKHGCAYPDAGDRTEVACTIAIEEMAMDPYPTFQLNLGDADDSAVLHNRAARTWGYNLVHLGAGKDTWTGTAHEAQAVYGDNGDDTLRVSGGAQAVGGKGDDTIYVDGEGGGTGGPGDDVLHGGPGHQGLYGDQGDDTLYGGPGDDLLYGGVGDDVMYGNSGDDLLDGDKPNGGRFDGGKDKLYGGPGMDELEGGPADDEVHQD
ncbi:calcium-binding protein [Streptomyces sp. NBC_00989]|uniref:calcium-binding protein n=1 Tax=Streptomyces sp. NBC_00989 TaxID=2903705 RepID=UPI003862E1D9|nr:calcium-binding protein [Streptomyces sp. NBC_00989]